jgi:hypothetical protein
VISFACSFIQDIKADAGDAQTVCQSNLTRNQRDLGPQKSGYNPGVIPDMWRQDIQINETNKFPRRK